MWGCASCVGAGAVRARYTPRRQSGIRLVVMFFSLVRRMSYLELHRRRPTQLWRGTRVIISLVELESRADVGLSWVRCYRGCDAIVWRGVRRCATCVVESATSRQQSTYTSRDRQLFCRLVSAPPAYDTVKKKTTETCCNGGCFKIYYRVCISLSSYEVFVSVVSSALLHHTAPKRYREVLFTRLETCFKGGCFKISTSVEICFQWLLHDFCTSRQGRFNTLK